MKSDNYPENFDPADLDETEGEELDEFWDDDVSENDDAGSTAAEDHNEA